MELQFNEYVKCQTKFGEVIAKFMMIRPDNQEVIVDYDNRLHQLPNTTVQYASNKDLEAFISARLFEYQTALEVAERSVDSCTQCIAELEPLIKQHKRKFKQVGKKRAAKGVMIRLMEANRQKGTEEYNKVSNEDFDLMENEHQVRAELYKCEEEIKKNKCTVVRGKEAIIGINKAIAYWQNKKEDLSKGIRNINRGGY